MHVGTAVTHHLYDDGETRREETLNHPFQLNTGDGRFATPKHLLTLEATQAKATRTLWAIGSSILAPSVVDTYHEEQTTKQSDLFGSSTTKETTHRETHKVLNFEAGISTNTIATSGGLDLTAPIMRAPKIFFDFPNGSLLLRSFEDWSSYNREELDKNAFLITSSMSGSSSKKVGEAQLNGRVTVTRKRPIHIECREDTYENNGPLPRTFAPLGATFDPKSDEFLSWEETKTFVGPGLSALIMIGVSLIMPGIGTGTTGAMLTAGAETLSTQAVVGMINNGGNILQTLEDMASADSLRSTAISMATAGLTNEFSIMSGVPIHPKGVEFVKHLESRMLHMAAQIPVESVLSRKSFEDVFQDCLIHGAAKLVGTYGAANIGNFFDKNQITEFQQYLAHAAVGAAAAKIKNGDVVAGALGAVVGEAVGKRLRAEMDESGINEDHPDYEQAVDHAVNIARFTAAGVACGLNQDAEEAAFAAGNAARHNAWSYNPSLPTVDQIATDVRHFAEDVVGGIISFAESGEALADVVSETVGIGGICHDVLRNMGHDAGLVAGIGLNAVGMWGGKGVKAPRIRKAPRVPIIPSNTPNLGVQQPVSILPTPPKLPPRPGTTTGKGIAPSSTIQKPNASISKPVGQSKVQPKKLEASSKPTPKTQASKKLEAPKQKTQTQSIKETAASKPAPKPDARLDKRPLPPKEHTNTKVQRTTKTESPSSKANADSSSGSNSRVRTINGRMPINAEYAGKIYPLEKLTLELRQKYPHSVPFTGTGHPDFSRYAVKKVKINMTGNRYKDNKMANKTAGYSDTPEGYTWHHHHDGETIMLIPQDLHAAIDHTGGVAIIKSKGK